MCVSQLGGILKSGDLYVEGGVRYPDYRTSSFPGVDITQELADYGKLVELPSGGKSLCRACTHLAGRARVPDRCDLPERGCACRKGKPIIRPLDKKPVPEGLPELEAALVERLQPVSILDVLTHTEKWLNWTRPFGPVSGYDGRLEHPVARYLTAVFCFGCNLGPSQTARSLDDVDRRRDVTWVNQRHITIEDLDEAIRLVIHAYHRFDLPRFWGTGKHVSADRDQNGRCIGKISSRSITSGMAATAASDCRAVWTIALPASVTSFPVGSGKGPSFSTSLSRMTRNQGRIRCMATLGEIS